MKGKIVPLRHTIPGIEDFRPHRLGGFFTYAVESYLTPVVLGVGCVEDVLGERLEVAVMTTVEGSRKTFWRVVVSVYPEDVECMLWKGWHGQGQEFVGTVRARSGTYHLFANVTEEP